MNDVVSNKPRATMSVDAFNSKNHMHLAHVFPGGIPRGESPARVGSAPGSNPSCIISG